MKIKTKFRYLEDSKGRISCLHCDKKFRKMELLKKHNLKKHEGYIILEIEN